MVSVSRIEPNSFSTTLTVTPRGVPQALATSVTAATRFLSVQIVSVCAERCAEAVLVAARPLSTSAVTSQSSRPGRVREMFIHPSEDVLEPPILGRTGASARSVPSSGTRNERIG